MTPDNINLPNQLLNSLQPNQLVLLQTIFPKMTNDMLWHIAEADYGDLADDGMEELSEMKKDQRPPKKHLGHLREVFQLVGWRNAETEKEHWQRLFACTNLLVMACDVEIIGGENQTLANFLESLLFLDKELIAPALQLLAWRLVEDHKNVSNFYHEEDTSFFIYAMLYLMLFSKKTVVEVMLLLNWLMAAENCYKRNEAKILAQTYLQAEDSQGLWKPNPTFLLGIVMYNQRHHTWKQLTLQLLPQLNYLENGDFKEQLLLLLKSITEYSQEKEH